MGFVDIVGIATSYVKSDFAGLSDSVVNMISLSCFLWFLVLSIPTGMLMNRIGRKNTVLLSFAVHVLAMCMPLIAYDFASVLIAFGLIGIGNTLLQVSMNPLVMEVVTKDKLTGTLTLGAVRQGRQLVRWSDPGRLGRGDVLRVEDDLPDLCRRLACGIAVAVVDADPGHPREID